MISTCNPYSNYSRALRGIIGLLAVFGLASPLAAASNEDRATEFYEGAVEYFASNSFSEAVIELRNTLLSNPNHLPARILLGRALVAEEQMPQAIKEFETALSMGGDENLILVPLGRAFMGTLAPERVLTNVIPGGHRPQVDGEIHLLHAEAYDLLGQKKAALEAYLDAGVLLPADPRPILGQAKIAAARQHKEQALRHIEQALALAPDDFGVWLFKAISHRDYREPQLAIDAFEQALQLRPNSDAALAARAALWLDLRRPALARADIDQALSINSANLEAVYLKTLLLFGEGKAEQARQVLGESADLIQLIKEDYRAKLPNTRLMLGVVAYFEKNYDEAISHLTGFLGQVPEHPGAMRFLGASLLSLGEYDRVISLYRRTPGQQPLSDPAALSLVAEAHRAKGDDRTAERMYEAALKIAPSAAGLGIRLAQSRFNAGRPEQAVAELEKLVERFPTLHEAALQLARMYVKLDRIDDGIKLAEGVSEDIPNNASLHNFLGASYMAKRDIDKAERYFMQAATFDPDNTTVSINLARISLMRGEPATAETYFRIVLESYPLHETAGLELADLLLDQGGVVEAEEIIERLIQHDPKRLNVQVAKLKALTRQSSNAEQIRETTLEIVQHFSDSPEANLIAGKVFAQMDDRESAQMYLRRAVEHAEFDAPTLYRIANAQTNIRDYNGALWATTKALQGNPDSFEAAVLRIRTLIRLDELVQAEGAVTKLIDANGDNSLAIKVLGEVRMAQGDFTAATTVYEQLFERSPNPVSLQSLFTALLRADQREKAMAMMQRWVTEFPRDYGSRLYYAQELLSDDRFETAAGEYEALYAADPHNVLILNNLANVYQRLGDNRALELAETAYERTRENPAILDTYGWILTESGDANKGLEVLRNAYARDSSDPTIRYHIGLALLKLGRKEEAITEFEAALAYSKGFPDQAAVQTKLVELNNGA